MQKFFIIILLFFCCTVLSQNSISNLDLEKLDGKKIELYSLLDGQKNMLLNVGGTWCKPCLLQKPFVASLGQQFPQYLNVVYLFYRDDSDKIIQKFGKEIIDKPYYIIDSEFLEKFSITTLPVNILIDPSGNIIKNDVSINDVGHLIIKYN